MSVLCIIQARLGSTRFPRKVLADICGKPMIQHVVERARQFTDYWADDLVLAVPRHEETTFNDLGLAVDICAPIGIDDNDVLTRFVVALANYREHDIICRVTGDCPLWNPEIGRRVWALYLTTLGCEYAWNVAPGYVDGEDCEIFSRLVLLRANMEATDPADREHVTPWIRRHYPVATLLPDEDKSWLKTSVDTEEDLARVRRIVEKGWASVQPV